MNAGSTTILADPLWEIAPGRLSINLIALESNWRLLAKKVAPAECAAVVKANGYGLGLDIVAPAFWRAGARTFFVAQLSEGLALRELLPSARIGVLNGLGSSSEASDFHAANLLPVLNDLGQVEAWGAAGTAHQHAFPAFIHLDTGMNRLGLSENELNRLIAEPERLHAVALEGWISHLACADEAGNPMTKRQLRQFQNALKRLPDAPASLANSSGIFREPAMHFDLVRPGVALYGVNPTPETINPMDSPIQLDARILQVRQLSAGHAVGYGATYTADTPRRIATIAIGYADGVLRSSGNRAVVFVGDTPAPVVGRVSMDLVTIDVSDIPEPRARPGNYVEIIGRHRSIDRAAAEAGTIGYEILTSLGHRYARRAVSAA